MTQGPSRMARTLMMTHNPWRAMSVSARRRSEFELAAKLVHSVLLDLANPLGRDIELLR
jgi:hypothetical protein